MSSRPARRLPLALALAALLAALLAVPSGAATADEPAPTDPGTSDVEVEVDDTLAAATDALGEVRELFETDATEPDAPTPAPDETVEEPRDATLALRELAQRQDSLPAAQAREAASFLARPTDGDADPEGTGYTTREATPVCSDVVCIHYVRTTRDRVPAADADGNGVPDYVDFALTTQSDVHRTYVGAGYRAPKSDGVRGGNALTDIYLADVGAMGFYGYCTTDDRLRQDRSDYSAYCVLDNDFAAGQFPTNTPRENLQVTAAHEYFHAVQFGYDLFEDAWFMEATATWAEDELFDDVDDNRQYLRSSPMTRPRMSMDQFTESFHYGTWIFFRYLSEKYTAEEGGMPTVVRDMWRRADEAGGRNGDYSLPAIRAVLGQRGTSLIREFALFSQANRTTHRSYAEGAANDYPFAPVAANLSATPRVPTARQSVTVDHLASATVSVRPAAYATDASWRLRVGLDLSPRRRGTAAVVTVVPRTGAPVVRLVDLDAAGNAVAYVAFSAAKIRRVEVTLVNANTAYDCGGDSDFSCGGRSRGDGLTQRVRVRAYQAS